MARRIDPRRLHLGITKRSDSIAQTEQRLAVQRARQREDVLLLASAEDAQKVQAVHAEGLQAEDAHGTLETFLRVVEAAEVGSILRPGATDVVRECMEWATVGALVDLTELPSILARPFADGAQLADTPEQRLAILRVSKDSCGAAAEAILGHHGENSLHPEAIRARTRNAAYVHAHTALCDGPDKVDGKASADTDQGKAQGSSD